MRKLPTLIAGAIVGAGVFVFATPYGEKAREALLAKYGELSEKAIATAQAAKQHVAPKAVPAEGAAEGEAPKTYIDVDGIKQKVTETAQKVAGAAGTYAATAKERGAAVAQTAKERGAAVAEAAKERGAAVAEQAKGAVKGAAGEASKDDELRAKIDEARERIAAQIAANAEAAKAAIAENAEDVAEKVVEAAEESAPAAE